MFDYAICEILGKQYKVIPNEPLLVDRAGEGGKEIEAQMLLLSEKGKIKVGNPYLKNKLTLDVLGTVKSKKIRVAKFHAKASYRRVSGSRAKKTKVIHVVKK